MISRPQTRSNGIHPAIQPEWLSLKQLTKYANVSDRTLRSWIRATTNPLPAAQVRGKILVRKTVFDTWLQNHCIKPLQDLDVNAIVEEILSGSAK